MCENQNAADWRKRDRKANPGKYRARDKAQNLALYGLSLEQYQAMWSRQNGMCLTCGETLRSGIGGAAVDHDHLTGAVRGILCASCNRALGYARDSPAILRRLADYLEKCATNTAA
ncbi:endonuclease VII domain-containing protein [Nocardioides soli]|uniref:endonuclease VII domain-containing protein n=1 Tax=Nocardioides soli TaxID=1036020 RepID=UPI001621E9BF